MNVRLENVSKAFGDKAVLSDFSAEFPEGKITCVMGPSGAGKTTLLNVIAGLLRPDAGTVTGVPGKISFVFQENRLCEDFGAIGNVRMVTGRSMSRKEIAAGLSELLPGEDLRKPVRGFSGGMKRRVAISRAIIYRPDLLLLDEPFKGLDSELKKKAADYIRRAMEGKTVICVTHDEEDVALLGAGLITLEKL